MRGNNEWALRAALKDLLPAAEAYLMSGDVHARFVKKCIYAKAIEKARAALSLAHTEPSQGEK